MTDMSGVIDLDAEATNKAAGKMIPEVIDLDCYAIEDMNAIDTSSRPMPNIIDADADSYANVAATKETTQRGRVMDSNEIIDEDSYADVNKASCSSALNFENTTSADEKVPMKDGYKEVIQAPKKPKLLSTTTKAPILPDQWVPDDFKKTYHVIEMGDAVYDAMLTHTNIENNINDFHVIQVLKANSLNSFMVYNRWGRVGEQGEIKLFGPHSSFLVAIQEFEDIFYKKTKNHWSDRKNFVSYPKNYTWLEMNYRKKDKKQLSLPCAGKRTYGPRVEKFMYLICNFSMMKQQMTDIGYDAEKLPLQNLSKSTISKAYDVLTLISEVIGESNRILLEELSGEFYTIIPHVFGDKSLREFVIDTRQKLRTKLEMVESLGEIEHAAKLLGNCAGQQEDVMFAQYQLLRCTLAPVEATTTEFVLIENYMKNTASQQSIPEIVQIFRVSREGENERFKKYAHIKNRMLLWHGSRLTNLLGILSQGLRIAPKEAPSSGASFGRGLYFADMFAKSAMYTYPHSRKTTFAPNSSGSPGYGILLLCEVALGEMMDASDFSRSQKLPSGSQSLKAAGVTAPSEHQVLEDGVIMPTGKAVTQRATKSQTAGRAYSEYVVYNEDQVRMRYIVQVDYNRAVHGP